MTTGSSLQRRTARDATRRRGTPGAPTGGLAPAIVAALGLLGLMGPAVGAASPSELWVSRYNSPFGDDVARAVAVDSAGNVFVTGSSAGNGTSSDYATVKYDGATGAQLWAARYDGPANGIDGAFAIAVDGTGNVVVTGESRDSGFGLNFDYATVKYDGATGMQLWAARYDGPGHRSDHAYDVAVDGVGDVVVTGPSMNSDLVFDYATVKYDGTTGAQLWVARYNGPGGGGDLARSMAVDALGDVLVTGESYGAAGAGFDYGTVKYNGVTGVQIWDARYLGASAGSSDSAWALALDSAGNVLVTGESGTFENGPDFATVKYDATTGAQVWASRYNGPGIGPGNTNDRSRAVAVTTWGYVAVTGESAGDGTGNDYATILYDGATGAQTWIARYNGPGNDADLPHAITSDSSGHVLVTGESEGDYVTLRYDASTGAEHWVARHNGPASNNDAALALALDPAGNILVTGISEGYGTVKYEGTSDIPDAFEPDDDSGEARQITDTQTHSIHTPGDADWVYFDLTQAARAIVSTSGNTPGDDTEIILYDSAVLPIGYDNDGGDNRYSRLESGTLQPGRYYVRVTEYQHDNRISAYSLNVQLIYDGYLLSGRVTMNGSGFAADVHLYEDPTLARHLASVTSDGGTGYWEYRAPAGSSFFILAARNGYAFSHGWYQQDIQSDFADLDFTAAPAGPPAPPTGLRALAFSDTQVILFFDDEANDESGFEVRRATSAQGPFAAVQPNAPSAPEGGTRAYLAGGLRARAQYWFQVRALPQQDAESGWVTVGPVRTLARGARLLVPRLIKIPRAGVTRVGRTATLAVRIVNPLPFPIPVSTPTPPAAPFGMNPGAPGFVIPAAPSALNLTLSFAPTTRVPATQTQNVELTATLPGVELSLPVTLQGRAR